MSNVDEQILVTVITVTYNHHRYIEQCLSSLLMQKVDFRYEVIVHDDASTDGTGDIVREFAKKYPSIIQPVLQKKNQWRLGKTMSKTFIYPKIRGKYVAFCEGDDYWTDPLKLQKQVDFFEAHPDCSIVFNPVKIHYESGEKPDVIYPSQKYLQREFLTLNDLLRYNFIQTNSVMYRWRFHDEPLDLIPDKILPGDWYLHLLHAEKGKIGVIPDVMGVYRKHDNGIWKAAGYSREWFLRKSPYIIRFHQNVEKHFKVDQTPEIEFMQTGYSLACRDEKRSFFLLNIGVKIFFVGYLFIQYMLASASRKISIRKKLHAYIISIYWNFS